MSKDKYNEFLSCTIKNADCKERAAVIHTWILKMLTWIDIYWNVVQESWFQSRKNEDDDKML